MWIVASKGTIRTPSSGKCLEMLVSRRGFSFLAVKKKKKHYVFQQSKFNFTISISEMLLTCLSNNIRRIRVLQNVTCLLKSPLNFNLLIILNVKLHLKIVQKNYSHR